MHLGAPIVAIIRRFQTTNISMP